jgi:excinuclease UvrABC nuclease subunit
MNETIAHYLNNLLTLVSITQIPFDENLHGTLPTVGGIYRVFEFGADWRSSIYVGKTGNLQDRVYRNLLMGDAQPHTLKRKLIASRRFADDNVIKQFFKERCLVQLFQLADERERSLLEHFAIAILKPEFND